MASSQINRAIESAISLITALVVEIIQQPGFCPRVTNALAEGHYAEVSGYVGQIACSVAYWVFVVMGHKVAGLTTDAQRKWFFSNLEAGTITVKNVGYVAPDNYPLRAVVEVFQSGAVEKIITAELGKALGGR